MPDRRQNWKEDLSKAARERQQQWNALLVEKEAIAAAIQLCGTDFEQYDRLKAKQREVIAKLARLSTS